MRLCFFRNLYLVNKVLEVILKVSKLCETVGTYLVSNEFIK